MPTCAEEIISSDKWLVFKLILCVRQKGINAYELCECIEHYYVAGDCGCNIYTYTEQFHSMRKEVLCKLCVVAQEHLQRHLRRRRRHRAPNKLPLNTLLNSHKSNLTRPIYFNNIPSLFFPLLTCSCSRYLAHSLYVLLCTFDSHSHLRSS